MLGYSAVVHSDENVRDLVDALPVRQNTGGMMNVLF